MKKWIYIGTVSVLLFLIADFLFYRNRCAESDMQLLQNVAQSRLNDEVKRDSIVFGYNVRHLKIYNIWLPDKITEYTPARAKFKNLKNDEISISLNIFPDCSTEWAKGN